MTAPTFNTPKLRQRSDPSTIAKDFAAIDAFAREQGVPTLVSPQPTPQPAPPPQLAVVASSSAQPRKAKPGSSGKRAATQRLIAELPDYLVLALKDTALKKRCTVRYLLTKALKADGYTVSEADLFGDGRGLR